MKQIIVFSLALSMSGLFSQNVSITVYNQNQALVKDVRSLELSKGISEVSFTDVASQIDPTSVHFKSLTATDKVQILEQNYEYDLVSGSKILSKYTDQDIRLVTEKGDLFQGMLLSASQEIVIQDDSGGIKILKHDQIQHFDLPRLPRGLITRPTLVWQVRNHGPEEQKTEISYLTRGMNWHAEYVALLNEGNSRLDLSGWVSIDNRSGATYENAKLKLVAGDVNVIRQRRLKSDERLQILGAAEGEDHQFEEKSFFEYHLYTLQRKSTLKDNQTKQISLFPPTATKTEKVYIYDGSRYGEKVRVHLEFKNSKADGLGIPLPKGVVRVYQADTDGALEFIGEDRIDHTPEDETVRLFIGNAFDIIGERIVKESRKISQRSRQESVEIVIKNHKKESVSITVVERFGTDWQITGASKKHQKKDAETAEFDVPVSAGGETMLTYTVLLNW
ncbi:DUF4139 domain-containing protein [bacterium]|nr:DUF4139 domain-containing protein [bacterium]